MERLKDEAESSRLAAAKLQQELAAQLESVEATKTELVEDARRQLQQQTATVLERLQKAERSMAMAEAAAQESAARRAASQRPPGPPPDAAATAGMPTEIAESKRSLTEVQRDLDRETWQPLEIRRVPWQERLKSGDRVYVRGIPRPVEVITPPEPSSAGGQAARVEVLLGTMRAKVPVYQLQRLAESHPAAAQHGVHLARAAGRNDAGVPLRARPRAYVFSGSGPGPELDLRGLRADEAVARVDAALNDAALDGLPMLRIIHGKGTGALRRAVRDYLSGHPLVDAAANGEGPGGEGVTVAQLR